MLALGGYFAIFPAITILVFGMKRGSNIYGLVYSGFPLAIALEWLLILFLKDEIGFENLFYIFFGFSVISGIILWTFTGIYKRKPSP